jgi:cytoskeletal protein CcmA (bactofilin family)
MSNPYDTASERLSILGPTLQFKGELAADEDLVILGRVDGTITHTQRLTVGVGGTVKANVEAQMVIVEGAVEGDLRAAKSVLVKESANVRGNIAAPSVSIQQGATFNGSVDMDAGKGVRATDTHDSAVHSAA